MRPLGSGNSSTTQPISTSSPVSTDTAERLRPVGHGLGYEHTFTHQAVDLVRAIAGEIPTAPTFRDALGVQRVLDAVTRSAADDSRSTSIDTAEESS